MKRLTDISKPATCMLLGLFLALATGCQSMKTPTLLDTGKSGQWLKDRIPSERWNPLKNVFKKEDSPKDFGQPVKMAAIWKDAVYEQAGTKPARGFGGRIFLYDANNQPVKADGELVVYGYDESSDSDVADHKYMFPADDFQKHYGETDLGHSYSVWIPWDKVGGDVKSITLIPMFKTETGQLVKGGSSINTLPGKSVAKSKKSDEAKPAESRSRVVQASFDEGQDTSPVVGDELSDLIVGPKVERARRNATSISVPQEMATRLAQLPAQGKIERKKSDPSDARARAEARMAHRVKMAELNAKRREAFKKRNDESKPEFIEELSADSGNFNY